MKYFVIVFAILFLGCFSSIAAENDEKPWDFFGVVFIPGVPSSSNDSNISGVRIGLPVSGGTNEMCGVEVGAACCWTKDVSGIQTAPLFCIAETVNGLQASPVTVADKVNGMQFGIVNISKETNFQLGVFNYMRDGILPFTIIMNFKF